METPNPKLPHHEVSSSILNPNSLPVAPSSNQSHLRNQAYIHNSNSWPLPPELTIMAFSNLDTKSLMQAMVCCTMFQKCAMDPLCYSHINLTTSAKTVNRGVVSTMIRRAGKELRFLELGHIERPTKFTVPVLTVTCLVQLSHNQGFIGKYLKSLHLYNVIYSSYTSCFAGLSACSNLTDLKIVGFSCENLLECLTTNCRFIEQLFLETYNFQEEDSSALVQFLTNIPNLTSLTLIGFRLYDAAVRNLTDNCCKLQYMNLSQNSAIWGGFLRDSGHSFKDGPLKTLILRDCFSLKETEVVQFINSISEGNFRFIKHIDVSNNREMVRNYREICYTPNFPLEKLKENRPGVTFVANFLRASITWARHVEYEEEMRILEAEFQREFHEKDFKCSPY